MMNEAGGSGAVTAPLSLVDLRALRSDYRDVPVAGLGGHELRVYALSGTARAQLRSVMADLTDEKVDLKGLYADRPWETSNLQW